ncbi:MAG: hypothetical protein A2622_12220 [Bdellovibrionales bacterium RIFCSPHIGHO2_01_FULL_40_29]|nr:MAG: hypothetical protein A2622_12220 [Bdellovibrionales bacterium RIFCSPHIGHO2_01_FULL_40_29]
MKIPKASLILASLIFSLFTATPVWADFTREKCAETLVGNKIIQVNRQWNEKTRRCFISVHPRVIEDLKYRDYYFDNSGFFMVFNSYGIGDESVTAGARGFFLLPQVNEYPDFSFEENNDVIVKMVSGHQLRISGKDFSIVSLSDGLITEKPLSPKNQGGVEFQLTRGYWLDGGFKLGGLPLDTSTNKTRFQSAQSTESCILTNKTYLNYESDGEFSLKFLGTKMTDFVRAKCPQLKL